MEQSVALILSKLDELILAAGGKIEGFYPYVLKQQMILGRMPVAFLGTFAVVFVLCLVYITKREEGAFLAEGQKLYSLDVTATTIIIVSTVVCLISAIFAITQGLPRLLNPHFYAVEEVIVMLSDLL